MTDAEQLVEKRSIVIHPVWWPIIIQTIGLLLAAFSYTSAMEHRLTLMESAQTTSKDILMELQRMNSAQDDRLRILESNQTRLLALEEFAYRGQTAPARTR